MCYDCKGALWEARLILLTESMPITASNGVGAFTFLKATMS